MSFLRSGQRLVTARWDDTVGFGEITEANNIEVWDFATGARITNLGGHVHSCAHIAEFPNNNPRFATLSLDRREFLWIRDANTFRPLSHLDYEFLKDSRVVPRPTCFALLPLGDQLVTVSSAASVGPGGTVESGEIRLWNLERNESRRVNQVTECFMSVAVSRGGRFIATSGSGPDITIWQLVDGAKVHVLKGHTSTPMGLSALDDGKYLATSSASDQFVNVWEWETGRHVATLPHSAKVVDIGGASKSRRILSTATNGESRVWDLDDLRAPVAEFRVKAPHKCAISENGEYLAVSGGDGIHVWQVQYAQKPQ